MASSSMARRSYQVFLSFRGKDIRKSFIDHLYTALHNVGIWTFKDDEELEKGKNIESELQTAILESRIAIIVFSENYASSRWCLDELVRILECKNSTGQSILPVFYKVEPSQVRYQTGSFSDAFTKHEERWTDKIAGWKAALREVADLGGMELKDEYESKFIKEIVQIVEDKLKHRPLDVPRYLIGIGYRVENINEWLGDGSSEVGMLSIYGTGGIGKTTIAKLVYNLNYRRFDASSFLPNVKETLEQSDGLLRLYKKLLPDLFKRDKVKIGSLDVGINRIRDVISCKKVLLVLDDVDQKHRRQLEPLLDMHHLFYEGSKIIITTRHKRLLKGHKACKEHELEKFNDYESLELFSWHAFRQDHPLEEYSKLSWRVVSYCGGLPLALHILGSSLCGESVDVWKNTLEKLEEFSTEILDILAVSYYSLPNDHDKNLFLDIACFFIGEEKSHVVTILNACDFRTTVGLENLINRCLLTVDNKNKLRMHQLIQDMGREIIRKESPNSPGKRSRLWHHKDSFNVLKQKTGTEIIQGLMLNMDLLKECKASLRSCYINYKNDMDLETDAFIPMQSLRLLHMSNVQLSGGYKQFPRNLRFLCWRGFPWRYVPEHFPLENLVAINMRNSNLKEFSTGTKVLRHMKILNLSHSLCLTKIQDFSQFPSLERLILEGCISLIEVHESVVEIKGLLLLNLKDCRSLKKLPSKIGMLEVLETLIISFCSNLEELPTDWGGMKCLKVFRANGITLRTSNSTSGSTLGTSPSITGEETSWRAFIWPWVSKTKQVPILSWNSLPRNLVCLSLEDCNLSDEAFPGDFCNMPSLQNIDLSGNPISFLPDCIKCFTRLNKLGLFECTKLQTLIGLPSIEEDLDLVGCKSLEKVTFQAPTRYSTVHNLTNCVKLVDIEGMFKVVPLGNINEEMQSYLGLNTYDLESMKSIEMWMFNRYTFSGKKSSIQGVYEYGDIFSIFLPGHSNFSGSYTYQTGVYEYGGIFSIYLPGPSNFSGSSTCQTVEQSLYFRVPSSPPNANIRGLILRVVYAHARNRNPRQEAYTITVLSNDTKGWRLEVYSNYYAVPRAGEEVIRLSHWNFESHQLEAGDEMHVLVYLKRPDVFEIKEIGIKFVYEDQEQTGAQSNSQEVGLWYNLERYKAGNVLSAEEDPYDLSAVSHVQIDQFHPLYLHPNDNPGMHLITVVLTEENYNQWKRAMTIALSAKTKLGMVNGQYTKPASSSPYIHVWNKCNDMIISWLLNSISSEIASSIVYLPTARAIWEDLSVRFTQSNIPKLYQIKKEMSMLIQGTKTVSTYFTKFRALYDEYSSLSDLPHCTCVCTCGAVKSQEEQDKIHKVTQFLMGLSDCYTNVRGQILMMKPIPDLNQIYALILQEEQQRGCTGGPISLNDSSVSAALMTSGINLSAHTVSSTTDASASSGSTALFSKGQFAGSRNFRNFKRNSDSKSSEYKRGNLLCTYCKGNNHVKETCFQLNGYPPWHPKHKLNSTSAGSSTSFSAAHSAVFQSSEGSSSGVSSEIDLTPHQLQQVMQYLKFEGDSKLSDTKLSGKSLCASALKFVNPICASACAYLDKWIIDSGATDHITVSFDKLINPIAVNAYIHLPNGKVSLISHKGTVKLNSHIVLLDVLFVPEFKFNLLSISKFTSDNQCCAFFLSNLCVFQDLVLKTLKGIGKLHDGLYIFQDGNTDSSYSYLNKLSSVPVSFSSSTSSTVLNVLSFYMLLL